MDINELRTQIDLIDDQLVTLFGQRMDVARFRSGFLWHKANTLSSASRLLG